MKDRYNNFHYYIDVSSLVFLLLPNLIFLIGWYKWFIGVPIAAMAVFLFYRFCIFYKRDMRLDHLLIPSGKFILLNLALSIFLAVVGGMGEFTFQVTDYIKHNVIFNSLTTRSWPVTVSNPEDPDAFLCYGVAYYLPAALLGKIFGLGWVVGFSFMWGTLGIFLSLLWAQRIANIFKWQYFLIVLALGGLDPLRNLLAGDSTKWNTILSTDGFGYPILLSYHSVVRLIVWHPQYLMPAWIGTGMIVHFGWYHKTWIGISSFVAALTVLWAPFITIGLIPIWVYFWIKDRLSNSINVYSLFSLLLVAVVGAYFASHVPIQDYPTFLWQIGLRHAAEDYVIFIFTEIGFIVIFSYLVDFKYAVVPLQLRRAMIISVAILLVLPLYRMGMFNDFLMRVSMPSLMLLTVVVSYVIYNSLALKLYTKSVVVIALLVFFTLGMLAPLRLLIIPFWAPERYATNSIMDSQYTVFDLNVLHDGHEVSFQYSGSQKSFYYRYLRKDDGDHF